jgi:hypothetical protein
MSVNKGNPNKEAFRNAYSAVVIYPKPAGRIALMDKGSDITAARDEGKKHGIEIIDLISPEGELVHAKEAIREAMAMGDISGIMGRQDMAEVLKISGPNNGFKDLKRKGIITATRLGSGFPLDHRLAFEHGIITERTPNGNKAPVRLLQDCGIYEALWPGRWEGNPSKMENDNIKGSGGAYIDKTGWDRKELLKELNWESVDFSEDTIGLQMAQSAELSKAFEKKKVAISGIHGVIGNETRTRSPFTQKARVVGYDPPAAGRPADGFKMEDTIEEWLDRASLIIFHSPGTEEMISNIEQLRGVEKGAILCNFSRGKAVRPSVLWQALQEGVISKAVLDVHLIEKKDLLNTYQEGSEEWYAQKLRLHPSVIATNHSAGSEVRALRENAKEGVRQQAAWILWGETTNTLEAPQVRFPYDAFLSETQASGVRGPLEKLPGKLRFALHLMHDGQPSHVIRAVHDAIEGALGGRELSIIGGRGVRPRRFRDAEGREIRNSAIDFTAFELDINGSNPKRAAGVIQFIAEQQRNIFSARVFVPQQ